MSRQHRVLPYEEPYDGPRRSRRGRRSRLVGCLLIVILILGSAVAGVAFWTFRDKIAAWARPAIARAEKAPRPDLKDALGSLRAHVAEIQQQWEKQSEPKKIRQRLQDLRKEIVARRDSAQGSARQYWDEIAKKSDALTSKTVGKTLRMPSEFAELHALIKSLESLSPSDRLQALTGLRSLARSAEATSKTPQVEPQAKRSTESPRVSPEKTPSPTETPSPTPRSHRKHVAPAVPPPDYQIGN